MKLPKAVQDQIDRANALHRESYPEQYSDGGNTPPLPGEAPPDETPPVDSVPGQDQDLAVEGEAPPAEPLEAAPAVAAAEEGGTVSLADYQALQSQVAQLTQSLNVLKGKYNAEPPVLHSRIRALEEELAAAKAETDRMRQGFVPPQPAASGGRVEVPMMSDLMQTPFAKWFAETYEPENLEMLNQHFVRVVEQAMNPLRETVQATAKAQVQATRDAYYRALDNAIPYWETIAQDPRFAGPFLDEIVPGTRFTRRQIAKPAEQSGDSELVLSHYRDFIEQFPDVVPKTAAPAVGQPKRSKEGLVAPKTTVGGGSGAPPPPDPESKKIYKASEITKLAREAVMPNGPWRGREKELAALRAKHDRAYQEGRVLPGV